MAQDPAVTELCLYAENNGDLYRQRIKPIEANLRKKMAKKTYKHDLAIKLWMYAVDDAAKKYAKEFGTSPSDWNKLFPRDVRLAVAKIFAKSFEAEEKNK